MAPSSIRLIVGSFNHDELYTLSFTPPSDPLTSPQKANLTVDHRHSASHGHSWLSLSANGTRLYATCWGSEPPAVAAYSLSSRGETVTLLNTKPIRNLSGYVCVSDSFLFSAGGATGEVFRLNSDGSIGDLVQELDFIQPATDHDDDDGGGDRGHGNPAVPHGNFGGLRFGAHSIDLSPDGHALYVADIGRNCIWTFSVQADDQSGNILHLRHKHISPRSHDGPRHTWPHPSGHFLYSLEEHSSMVDVYAVAQDGVTLSHRQACNILPADRDCGAYWADEIRLSTGPDAMHPRFLYASTRGLQPDTKGYVTVFPLSPDGSLASEEPLDVWETPTSGGIANAIALAPCTAEAGEVEYLALTDSQDGWVFMLRFDGRRLSEIARTKLGALSDGRVVQAATAVWLSSSTPVE